jgi:hypothetical protein
MQPAYMLATLALPSKAQHALAATFGLQNKGSLFFRLSDAKIDHAKAVIALLRAEQREAVEVLLGKPIVICPPCLSRMHEKIGKKRTYDEARIIASVKPNPRHPASDAYQRYGELKAGMTVAQALRRGVSRRDIREWIAEGAITIKKLPMKE